MISFVCYDALVYAFGKSADLQWPRGVYGLLLFYFEVGRGLKGVKSTDGRGCILLIAV
jgi:hypothetical protein